MFLTDAPTFDNRLSLGTLMQMGTMIAVGAAFVFRKYYNSEEDNKRVDKHEELIGRLTELNGKSSITQETQQKLLEHMEKRINILEDNWTSWVRTQFNERRDRERERDQR